MAVGTLQAMIARIVLEMGNRADLQADGSIADAINTAITTYQKMRFRWNELAPLTPFTFAMIPGQPYYDKTLVPKIGLVMKIDYLNTVIGSTTQKLDRVQPEEIYLALQTGQQVGQPLTWAWDGNSIIFYPQPDQAWPITVGGYLAVAGPATSTEEGNVWMNEAERLIRSRAKYELAVHRTRNIDMQKKMSPFDTGDDGLPGASADALAELLAGTSRVIGTSRVTAMRF